MTCGRVALAHKGRTRDDAWTVGGDLLKVRVRRMSNSIWARHCTQCPLRRGRFSLSHGCAPSPMRRNPPSPLRHSIPSLMRQRDAEVGRPGALETWALTPMTVQRSATAPRHACSPACAAAHVPVAILVCTARALPLAVAVILAVAILVWSARAARALPPVAVATPVRTAQALPVVAVAILVRTARALPVVAVAILVRTARALLGMGHEASPSSNSCRRCCAFLSLCDAASHTVSPM
eukprot:137417-Chlamydomonas_euryale.AAC.4